MPMSCSTPSPTRSSARPRMGDIGHHFPPSDEAYRGISSVTLLERGREIVAAAGYEIANVDATIIAEEPKIGPHADRMRCGHRRRAPDRCGSGQPQGDHKRAPGVCRATRRASRPWLLRQSEAGAEPMRVLLQRVSSAAVRVDGEVVGEIEPWPGRSGRDRHADTPSDRRANGEQVRRASDLRGRRRQDESLPPGLWALEPEGAGMLVVSQFTLYADVRKGRRPSFTDAAPPNLGQELVDHFAAAVRVARHGGRNWSVRRAHGRQSRQRWAGHDLARQRGARAGLIARIGPATSGLFGVSV